MSLLPCVIVIVVTQDLGQNLGQDLGQDLARDLVQPPRIDEPLPIDDVQELVFGEKCRAGS